MKLLYLPKPANLRGLNLAAELGAALGIPANEITVGLGSDPALVDIRIADNADEAIVAATVAAHTGAPTPEQQARADADTEALAAFGSLGPVLAKCRDVYAGNGSFTAAQRDKILAGLVLLVNRRLG